MRVRTLGEREWERGRGGDRGIERGKGESEGARERESKGSERLGL